MSNISAFTAFTASIKDIELPNKLNDPFDSIPHPLCLLAAQELQTYIQTQTEWNHNFGLTEGKDGQIIGKMFGVLVVKNNQNVVGYLSAFSGKMAGGNVFKNFVPPVYDALIPGSFLNLGMQELTKINNKIKQLEIDNVSKEVILEHKNRRKNHSIALQDKLFDHYTFLNTAGNEKGLKEIFLSTPHGKPSSGAGECAAPKLFQYAFQHHLKPLAIAEFWWGLSPKSDFWKHKQFYPSCEGKCRPILGFMLDGVDFS